MTNTDLSTEITKRIKVFFVVSGLVAILGLLLSIYATNHHLKVKNSSPTDHFACNINDMISCDKIAQSPYSEFYATPLGVWGIGFFAALIGLLCWAYLIPVQRKLVLFSYTILTLIGALCSLVLAFISFQLIKVMCLICVGVYLCNFLQLGFLWGFKKDLQIHIENFWELRSGLGFSAGVVALVVLFFHGLKPQEVSQNKIVSESSQETYSAQPRIKQHDISLATNPLMGKGEDYRLGSSASSIIIHEFVDFECPACKLASASLKELAKQYPRKLLVVFRNFPLDSSCNSNITREFHENSCLVARMARCAGRIGKFWDFHDLAFSEQNQISTEKAKDWARKSGLSEGQINNCLQDESIMDKIRDDISLGQELGVQGTPSLYINGLKFHGSLDSLKLTIENLLNNG